MTIDDIENLITKRKPSENEGKNLILTSIPIMMLIFSHLNLFKASFKSFFKHWHTAHSL